MRAGIAALLLILLPAAQAGEKAGTEEGATEQLNEKIRREESDRVRRAVVVADGPEITPTDLGFEAGIWDEPVATLNEARARGEAECLQAALRRTHWNKSEAARLLGIGRTHLYELIRRHRPDVDDEP